MDTPEPPHRPSGEGAERSAQAWAEYLRRYDRYLELFAQSLEQQAEYNRLLAEHTRLEDEQGKRQERQAAQQRSFQLWSLLVLVGVLVGLGGIVLLPRLLEW